MARPRWALAAVAAAAIVCVATWVAGSASAGPPLAVEADAASVTLANVASSEDPVTVGCAGGATLVGGGFRAFTTADGNVNTTVPNNGLVVHGSLPTNGTGTATANGGTDPAFWTAVGAFSGQAEVGDSVTAFAMCATAGPSHTQVVTATVNGPTVAATTAAVTAACPGSTSLLGGGGFTNDGTVAPSFKLIGSFPSNAVGVSAANGASNPAAWTAVGGAGGGGNAGNTTTAYALCSTDATPMQTTVVRTDVADSPSTATSVATATATCAGGTQLIGGGELADGSASGLDGGVPQQGVHVRGSYPSGPTGVAVVSGTSNPSSWTAIVQSGGQATPGTDTHAWALCALAPVSSATLFTQASVGVTLDGSISDTATLAGGSSPTGTITFNLYGPGDTTCATAIVAAVSTRTVAGNGVYTSTAYTPTQVGTYQWIASYSGDGTNAATTGHCGDSGESVVVGPQPQTISFTTAPPSVATVGGPAYSVAATASSGLTVALSIDGSTSGVCSLAGSTVTFTAVGMCKVDANQAGNASFAAAPQQQQSFAVGAAPAPPITPSSGGSASAKPGSAGSLTITGPDGETVTASWPASGLTAQTDTVNVSAVLTGAGFGDGTIGVKVTVTGLGGKPVTQFASPLDVAFRNAPAGVVPAYSPDGTTWTAIPEIVSPPALPVGWPDGWYRTSGGALHVLTRHATYFAALKPKSKVKPALVLTTAVAKTLNLAKTHALIVSAKATLRGKLTLSLRRNGRLIKTWQTTVTATVRKLKLALPPKARHAGAYSLALAVSAGKERAVKAIKLKFVRPAHPVK